MKRILGYGLDVIGMLKNNRQMYHFSGGFYNLESLAAYFARMNTAGYPRLCPCMDKNETHPCKACVCTQS